MNKKIVCPHGKRRYDKKGAVTMKNLSMKLHHIEMEIYECPDCKYWHLASVGKHKQFRHNANRLTSKKEGVYW